MARNPNSSAKGPFQFIDATARQYGLQDPFDVQAATDAAARLARDNAAILARATGRQPTAAELYLAHQQGGGGAAKLLANPNARAVDIVGRDAVRLNGGREDMTAGEFAGIWLNKFNRTQGQQGLLASNETVSTQGRTAGQGEPMAEERGLLGGLLNPDRRDRLIMALEGMTLNPNQALIQASGEAIKGRAESQQSKQAANRTAAWLRSQGREDLAAAVESGAVSGKDAASAALQPPADDRTAGLKEYEAAVQQGFQGSFLDYKTALAQAGRPETNVNVGTGEGAFQKKTGEVLATEAAEIVTQGAQAQRSLGQIQVLEGALQRAPSGALGSITNMAANLGIKTEGASDIELANSIISQLVPQQRPPGSGVMSDADLELFKQSLPRLINTREGNQMIINTMKSIAEYDMQRAAIARQLQLGQITPEDAFAAYQSLGNPIPPELRTGGAPAAGGQAGGGSKRMRFNPETGQLEAVQ